MREWLGGASDRTFCTPVLSFSRKVKGELICNFIADDDDF
jgi:hypothetical protein